MSLPCGYKILEYIESSGTQYVDTDFKPNQNTRLVVDFQSTTTTALLPLFGTRDAAKVNAFAILTGSTSQYQFDYGTSQKTNLGAVDTSRHTFNLNKNVFVLDGTTKHTATSETFSCSYPLFLFTVNNGGAAHANGYRLAKLYSCQIYDNGTLVRDFIPCQTSSDEVGLWDDVDGKFYGNAGTETFAAGPVISEIPDVPDVPDIPDVPSVDPIGFDALGVTMQAAVLVWGAVNPGQHFRLYRNDALIYEGTDTHYTDSGLIPDVAYSYRIAGFNGSEESAGLSLDIRTRDAVWLITDRTDRDTGDKGHYNCLDLIRVNEALDYVADLLRGAGYMVSVNTRKDWSMNDIPTVAQMEAYIQSTQNIKNTMEYLSTTPQPPRAMNRLTWQQANDIEQLLVDAEYTVFHIHDGLKRTGQFDAWCGPGPRFATAKHDDGRTWEELDAMETEWSGWDAATWYSLLYGHVRGEVS